MPTIDQLRQLVELLETLPADAQVYFDPKLSDNEDWTVEPILASCDDPTVLGYVVTNRPTMH